MNSTRSYLWTTFAKICLWRAPAHRVDDDDDDPGESDALDTRHETSPSVDWDAQSSRKVGERDAWRALKTAGTRGLFG
jgi:hypothetical protein